MSSKLNLAVIAAAVLFLLAACAPTVVPNGDVVKFQNPSSDLVDSGETKVLSNGTSEITLTYFRNGGWGCQDGREGDLCVQDVSGETMFFFGTDKVGTEDIKEGGKVILYGEWHEKTE